MKMSDESELKQLIQKQFEQWCNDMKRYGELCEEPKRYCNNCPYFILERDPDIHDWFEDNLQMAKCLKLKVVIEGSLESWECSNIERPLYCPELNRPLLPEEKEQAAKDLEFARKRTSL